MTEPLNNADIDKLINDLSSQIGDDAQKVFLSESLHKRSLAAIREFRARLADEDQEAWDRFAAALDGLCASGNQINGNCRYLCEP